MLLVVLATTGTAEAADGKKKVLVYEAVPMSERESRNDIGSCLLLSHDCEICASDEQDNIVCSSVGIACVSTERRC